MPKGNSKGYDGATKGSSSYSQNTGASFAKQPNPGNHPKTNSKVGGAGGNGFNRLTAYKKGK